MLSEISFASKHAWIWKILRDPLYNKLNAVERVYVSLEWMESLFNTLKRSA
jgi:hypothetical protein